MAVGALPAELQSRFAGNLLSVWQTDAISVCRDAVWDTLERLESSRERYMWSRLEQTMKGLSEAMRALSDDSLMLTCHTLQEEMKSDSSAERLKLRLDSLTIEGTDNNLHLAARSNHSDVLRVLLSQSSGSDIREMLVGSKCRDSHSHTPLHSAARLGNLETIKILLRSHGREQLLLADNERRLPLHHAVLAGAPAESIALLLRADCASEQLLWPDKDRQIALHSAAKAGYFAAIMALLEHAAAEQLAFEDSCGNCPASCTPPSMFQKAAREGRSAELEMLLSAGWNPLVLTCDAQSGQTPLHCAARAGELATMRALLGVDAARQLMAKDGYQRIPLHQAALSVVNNIEAMHLLLDIDGPATTI